MKRVVYIGGFGHWPQVAEEFCGRSDVNTVGVAPAYESEDMSVLRNHSALHSDLPVFSSAIEMLLAVKPEVAVVSTRPDYIARTAILAAEGYEIVAL